MNNNKDDRDFADFFREKNRDHDKTKSDDQKEENGQPNSFYYSYGPFKSSPANGSEAADATTAVSSSGETSFVQVTAPRPVHSLEQNRQMPPKQTATDWNYGQAKKRSPIKGWFASFLAGALVVGSLMVASDKMNLFTHSEGVFGNSPVSGSSETSANDSNSGGGNVTNTALDMVRPNNISDIVKKSSPAVVKIETYVKANSNAGGGSSIFNDPLFRQFFGDDFFGQDGRQSQPQDNAQPQPAGMGSGFVFDKDGYILTNQHVVEGADEIRVWVEGYSKPFKAKLLGSSFDLDLAALKIEGSKGFPTLKLGSSDDLNVGDWVVAIGNPYGFDHTVTVGVLSAKERPIEISERQDTRKYEHLLQTDASINPGNSGGPLLNLDGEVIGINTAVSAQAQGIGFAIPTTTINGVLDKLKNDIKIPKAPEPYIGATLQDIDKSWVKDLRLDSTDGSFVREVIPFTSPAYKAGLRDYDVIIAIDGEKVKTTDQLIKIIKSKKVGDKVQLTIVRNGKKANIEVVIGNKNDQNQQQ